MNKENIVIRPNGFLKEFLNTQVSGLTGHIQEAGFPFDTIWWGENISHSSDTNPAWWVYEQTAYWLDGYIKTGILLDDEQIISRSEKIIYNVINNPDCDGYLGPNFMKQSDGWNRWPHVVFFRACMGLYNYNHDKLIVEAISNHYLNDDVDYGRFRDVMNVEIMLWLYGINKNEKLLKKAIKAYDNYNITCKDDCCNKVFMSDSKLYIHGVTFNEYAKLGAILYIHSKDSKYLTPSIMAYKKIDKYYMLPAGCHCSNEFLISKHYMESYETCDISDFTWALNYMFLATKDSSYLDKIEQCIFNAGIGSVLEDFKGLQYFSCANQIIAANNSNHNDFFKGEKWMSYRPNPGTECCPGNVNRFMPNYILNAYDVIDNSVYIKLFGSMTFKCDDVSIIQESNYPFDEEIKFTIKTTKPFDLYVRIPNYSRNENIEVSENIKYKKEKGFLHFIITSSETINIKFESKIEIKSLNGGLYLKKGPLVYSYGQYGNRIIDNEEQRSSKDFPAYNIYPDKKWQYAISKDCNPVYIKGKENDFNLLKDINHIQVDAYEVLNWDLTLKKQVIAVDDLYKKHTYKKKGEFVFTPKFSKDMKITENRQRINLYPYAACKLRMTVLKEKKTVK